MVFASKFPKLGTSNKGGKVPRCCGHDVADLVEVICRWADRLQHELAELKAEFFEAVQTAGPIPHQVL